MTVSRFVYIGGGTPPPPPPVGRPAFVYATYQPPTIQPVTSGVFGQSSPAATAGLLDSSLLTDYNAPSTQYLTLADGEQITNKTIYGNIRPPSTHNNDIVLTNCLPRGGPNAPTSDDAVINAQGTRSGNGKIILVDCEVWPQVPQLLLDGVRGNRHETYRSWIHDTIDGWESHAYTNQNGGDCLTVLEGSVVENLRYMYPEPQHIDGTHNDILALNGGKQIHVEGNFLNGTSTDLPGSGNNPTHPQLQATGFTMGGIALVTNTVSNPLDATCVVRGNWVRGGLSHWNVKANMVAMFEDNHHYRAVAVISTSSGYWVRYDQRAGNGLFVTTDDWIDGPYAGTLLIEPQTRGIHFNT